MHCRCMLERDFGALLLKDNIGRSAVRTVYAFEWEAPHRA